MNIPVPCRVCSHDIELHRGSCGHQDCSCLGFVPPAGDDCEALPEPYQEAAMMAVLDLIMAEKEGTIVLDTHDGRTLRIKVVYVPGVGYEVNSAGGRA